MSEEGLEHNIRRGIRGVLQLFASPSAQWAYQNSVPFISVPAELFCQWADDFYHPNTDAFRRAFRQGEQEALAEFHEVFEKAAAKLGDFLPGLADYWTSPQAQSLALAAAAALKRLDGPDVMVGASPGL